MKLRPTVLLLLAVTAVLAGCSTTASRIREKPEVFAALPAEDQARLRQGTVAIGDTPDMVYIAIGTPTRRQDKQVPAGRETTWIYRSYYERYDGDVFTGYRRRMGIDPRTGRRIIFLEPCYTEVYHAESEEHLRVTFENDRVTAIEELKR